MRVTGQIKDGASGEAIPGARVHFEVGSTEATSRTDASGAYQWSDDTSYLGKTLRCRVEKEGYEPRETTLEVDRDRIRLDLELTSTSVEDDEPEEPPTDTIVSMKLRVRDPSGRGVEGATVKLGRGQETVDTLISGPQGRVVSRVSGSRAGETLEYRVEAEGFEAATGTVPVEAGFEHLVTLERSDAPEPWWKRAWAGFRTALGGFAAFAGDLMTAHRAITAVLAIALAGGVAGGIAERTGIINLFDGDDGPSPLAIQAFRAHPPSVEEGRTVTLTWETSGAERVEISGLGEREPNGSATVTPEGTTEYEIVALGGSGSVERTVTVEVRSAPPPPENPLNALLDEFDIYLADGRANPGKIYQVRSGGAVTEWYERSSGRLSSLAVGPDGRMYFVNANRRSIFRIDGGAETRVYRHTTLVRDLAFDRQGHLYFSESTGAGGDGMIYRFNRPVGTAGGTSGQDPRVSDEILRIRPSDSAMIARAQDPRINDQIVGVRPDARALRPEVQPAPVSRFRRVPLSQVGGFWAGDFAFDPTGSRLFVSSGNRVPAQLYEFRNGRFVQLYSLEEPFTGFTFVAQDRILFTNHRQTLYLLEDTETRSSLLESPQFEWIEDVAVVRR